MALESPLSQHIHVYTITVLLSVKPAVLVELGTPYLVKAYTFIIWANVHHRLLITMERG